MKYKMVAIDVDGTLVDKNGNMAAEDIQAIKRLTHSSVTVALCTGRSVQSTKPFIDELGLKTFHIFYDGAFIANTYTKCKMHSQHIDADLVCEVVAFCRNNNIYLELCANGAVCTTDSPSPLLTNWSATIDTDRLFVEKPYRLGATHHDFLHMDPTVVNFDDIIGKEDILKAEIFVGNDDEAMQAKQFKDYFGDRLNYSIVQSPSLHDVYFINVLHPQVSKGEAFKQLIDYWGYHPAEIIAIGDNLNDISLLGTVGVSVAMGNACDELKHVANYITNPIEEHGVATAIKFFFQL